MISLRKILVENYQFDADDYMPYYQLTVGDIVRDSQDEMFKVLEKSGDNKVIASLVDDPRDIRAFIYGDEVVAHESDQEGVELDEPVEECDSAGIEEVENSEGDLSPESILDWERQLFAEGRGFNVSDIEQALRDFYEYEDERDIKRHLGSDHHYLDIANSPGRNGTKSISFNSTGKDDRFPYTKIYTISEFAREAEHLLKTDCDPAELAKHVIGWMIGSSEFRPALYPMLDEEGVKIYKKAEKDLDDDIRRFYSGKGNWTGD